MDLEFNNESLQKYILECREEISRLVYRDLELQNCNIGNLSEATELKKNLELRNKMINTKIDHTARIVQNAILAANALNLNMNIKDILKNAALLHDIGRFKQYTLMSSGSDAQFKINKLKYKNHGDLGASILFEEQKIKDYDIPQEYYNLFHKVIKYHGDELVPNDINFTLSDYDYEKIQGVHTFDVYNKHEKIVISFLIQLIRDIDMIDILFQYLTDDLNPIGSHIKRNNNMNINKLEENYGISKKEILEYNNLTEKNFMLKSSILIPVKNMTNVKLKIPTDIKERILNRENISLSELSRRSDFSQVTAFWWRISIFINKISFNSVLDILQNTKLLEKIYDNIPLERIELFEELFDYVYELIEEKKTDNIYSKKTLKKQ